MRALGPLPLTLERSTPSVRAKARTDGDACAPRNAWSSTGAAGLAVGAGSGAAAAAGDGAAEGPAVGASVLAPAAAGASFLALGALAAAAAPVSSVRMTLPSLTLSPTLTFNSFTVPADGAGTSIVALSDSSVTSGSSGFTASPGLTKTSMTGTSLKSPMSGTLTSIVPAGPAAAGAACSFGLASCAAAGRAASLGLVACAAAGAASVPAGRDALAAGAAFPPPSADSSVRIALPSLTLSPTLTLRSLTVPALGAGTSMVALSDSSVTSESSAFTASPGLTKTSMTGTSLKSPMSGTLTSIVLMETSEAHPRRRKAARDGRADFF